MPSAVVVADIVEEFIAALQGLEDRGDVDGIVALFAADAAIETPAAQHLPRSADAVRYFWRHYRGAFESVKTEFVRTLRDGEHVCLEWVSRALPRGDHAALEYRGVTLLDLSGGCIRRLRSYYDTRPFAFLG